MYSMGEFSQKVDLSADTLRYYEKLNLIVPQRSSTNRRCYAESDVKWIEFIKRLKMTGMPMKQITRYSELRSEGNATIRARIDLLVEQKNLLEVKRREIDEHLLFLNDKLKIYNEMLVNQQSSES